MNAVEDAAQVAEREWLISITVRGENVPVGVEAYLAYQEDWTEETAERLALADGIVLNQKQRSVITMARGYFMANGGKTADLETLYSFLEDEGLNQRREMFVMFYAPLTQICRYACIPLPGKR